MQMRGNCGALSRPASSVCGAGGHRGSQPLPQLLRRALHGRLSHAHRRAALHRENRPRQSARLRADDSRRQCARRAAARESVRYEVLCEGACVLHRYNKQPIEIARLQRFAMDAFHAAGGKLLCKSHDERPEKIACVGAGPASLACAAELRQQGFQVTVFERRPLPGGLNTYGVAEYKLPARASLEEIELIRGLGVEFRYETEIRDPAGPRAAGAGIRSPLSRRWPGRGASPRHPRRRSPRCDRCAAVHRPLQNLPHPPTIAESVAVIGAGNTAIDAANAARRLGAANVAILYRRAERHMSAFAFEYEHAKQEGVRFLWRVMPVRIHSNEHGIRSIECVQAAIGDDGVLAAVPGSNFHFDCQQIIYAIGQSPLLELLSSARGLRTEQRPRRRRSRHRSHFKHEIFCRRRLREWWARSRRRSRRRQARRDRD